MSEQVKSLSEYANWGGGFPAAHEYSVLEQLDNTAGYLDEALVAADALINRWQPGQFAGLFLYGSPGNGKTHFATGLARSMADRGVGVAYLHLPMIDTLPEGGLGYNAKARSYELMKSFASEPGNSSENFNPECIYSNTLSEGPGYMERLHRDHGSFLFLDEYRPGYRGVVLAAMEAAAERGGLVVVTSNYENPFNLVEAPKRTGPRDDKDVLLRDMAERVDPEAVQRLDAEEQAKEAELSASIKSRILAGVRLLPFTGPSRREENSFWNKQGLL